MSWPSKHQQHRLKPTAVHSISVTPGFTELSISFIHWILWIHAGTQPLEKETAKTMTSFNHDKIS